MNNSQKLVRIRLKVGKPKRKSGAYVMRLFWGSHKVTRIRNEGEVISLKTFHKYQLEEGSNIFDGLDFKLIPYEQNNL